MSRLKILKVAGIAALASIGLAACGSESPTDTNAGGNTEETDGRCFAAREGRDNPGIRYNEFGASLLPLDTWVPDRLTEYDLEGRSYDEDRYLIGWTNGTTSDPRPDQLQDPYLAVWSEEDQAHECTIVELSAGGRIESIGDDRAHVMYVYRPMEELPADDTVILTFTTPVEGEDYTVSQEVWNFSDHRMPRSTERMLRNYLDYAE